MRRVGRIVALVVLLGLASVAGASEHQGGNNDYPEGEVLVLLKAPVTAESVSAAAFRQALSVSAAGVAASAGAQAVSSTPAIAEVTGKDIVLMRSGEKTTEELLQALEGNPAVLAASPNYRVYATWRPNDPYYTDNSLWGLNAIRAPAAWDRSVGSRSVYVAVLDSGINYNHEDLAANMGRDLSGRYGWDFWNNDNNPMDDNGHGTHVAGTIGAVGNNGRGVTGVNWQVSLLAVKVLGSNGGGTFDSVAQGLNYITEQKRRGRNIRVANLSLAGWAFPYEDAVTTLRTACRAAADQGILLVFAAGNESQYIDNPTSDNYKGKRPYPAAFDESNMITVTAINSNGTRAYNYSSRYVHLAAPGVNIWSTYHDGGYARLSGSSMATPHVAGAAALLAARYPSEAAWKIRSRILGNVMKTSHLSGQVATGGYLNLQAAMASASPTEEWGGGGCSAAGGVTPAVALLLLPLGLLMRRKK
ncbi:MAG: S8 family serine peptidase [Aminivibrio sp.]|uniref:S8 family serine peptidase n=1 Tax=Aminivibrio sp. TaxID=1872489 RepID=UPI002B207911|nr:S8 family serine peptidase [Aminivibrio sp.]MEA4953862.1 S8 family serine peptidase [Aminivibrio sp.]